MTTTDQPTCTTLRLAGLAAWEGSQLRVGAANASIVQSFRALDKDKAHKC